MHLEEPVENGDAENSIEPIDRWDADYVGTCVYLPSTGYCLLDELRAKMPYRPHAIVLDEIGNWADLPHLSPGFGGRVPTDDVRDFITQIHGISRDRDTDGSPTNPNLILRPDLVPAEAKVEAWWYTGEREALMLGLEAWVFGQDLTDSVQLGSGEYSTSDDEVGLQITVPCSLSATSDFALSFLHYDLVADEDGVAPTSYEDLRLHVYVQTYTSDWSEVGEEDPRYADDAYGGFRFDGGDPEGIELIEALIGPSYCLSGPSMEVKIVAECHSPNGLCDANYFPEQNFAYVADVQVSWDTLTETIVEYVPLYPNAIDVSSQTAFHSTSNEAWRYLDLGTIPSAEEDEVDSIIVRYEEIGVFEQIRLMQALGRTVEEEDLSLTYIETNSWENDLTEDYLGWTLLNSEYFTDGVLAGNFSMAYWDVLYRDHADGGFGEHAERFEIHVDHDANDSPDLADDFTLLFFYPNDRKFDAWPGWYQRYTTTVDIDALAVIDPGIQLSFEIGNWACSGCMEEVDEYGEPITEGDRGHRYYLMGNDGSFNPIVYNNTSEDPMEFWVKIEGKYNVAVTMYTIDKPEFRRHGFFRMVDNSVTPNSYGNLPTVNVGEWEFNTGTWTTDPEDPDYLELPWGLDGYWALGTDGYDMGYVGVDEGFLSHESDPYGIAALQARDLMVCIDSFWIDDVSWGSDCIAAGDW